MDSCKKKLKIYNPDHPTAHPVSFYELVKIDQTN